LSKAHGIHPLIGQWVKVIYNHFKGYYALVKDVGSLGITIEIKAQLVVQNSAWQLIQWSNLMVVYVSFFFTLFCDISNLLLSDP
jgi:hypothetical protein